MKRLKLVYMRHLESLVKNMINVKKNGKTITKVLFFDEETGFWICSTGIIYKEKKDGTLEAVKQIRDQGHNGGAYLRVYSPLTKKRYYAHRLVAKHFLSGEKNQTEVNHKDMNVWNNRVENLEWVSPKENRAHAANFDKSKLDLPYKKVNKKWIFLDNK